MLRWILAGGILTVIVGVILTLAIIALAPYLAALLLIVLVVKWILSVEDPEQ